MTGRVAVNTDLNFVQGLMLHGAADLKKCYQCSTCTVACPLTPNDEPFPRKEMLWAQWGMKDKLFRDMDLWLCHNCNDCTDQCPRGAKPGEVMSALRNQTIEHYSYPQAIGKRKRRIVFDSNGPDCPCYCNEKHRKRLCVFNRKTNCLRKHADGEFY